MKSSFNCMLTLRPRVFPRAHDWRLGFLPYWEQGLLMREMQGSLLFQVPRDFFSILKRSPLPWSHA